MRKVRDVLTVVGLLASLSLAAAGAAAPKFRTIYNLTSSSALGNWNDIAIGRGGVLYGVSRYGVSPPEQGAVFSLTPPASAGEAWTYTLLYSFAGPDDGYLPEPAPVIGAGGVLYGATYNGGSSGLGIVYSLTPPASPGGPWTESVLHSFTGSPGDGGLPNGVTIGKGGVLYGTTAIGGSSGTGTAFSLTPPASAGGAWTYTVIYDFMFPDAGSPSAPVVIGKVGVLYGTTANGGTFNSGTVYSLTPPTSSGGSWTEAVLYNFTGGSDGGLPISAMAIGKGGVLYGTTYDGGSSGGGTVFSVTPPASPGGPWTESVLYEFSGTFYDVALADGVVIGEGGVLYGINPNGGASTCSQGKSGYCGAVFSLTPPASAGGAWTENTLHNFMSTDGGVVDSLVVGKNASGHTVLFGSTGTGGANGAGTIFALKP